MTPLQTSLHWSLSGFDASLVADELLASRDIAEMNLACAAELPGTAILDVPACLATIDDWSEKVRAATSRNYDRFIREPDLFDRSLGRFCMVMLSTTLQRDCGVRWPFPHPDPDVDPRYYLRSYTPREELAAFLCIRSIVLMDNGKFVQAIQPAGWARQLSPGDYSIKVHLELTMLFALGILDEKPAWMDEHPVIRPDGVAWSRYWWPRPLENRELLPAARLPRHVLAGILPRAEQESEVGDLADALYERASQYADEAYVAQVRQAAIAAREAAEASFYNALNRARWKAFIEETARSNRDDLARRNAALRGVPAHDPMPRVAGPELPPHTYSPFGSPAAPTVMPVVPGGPQPTPPGGHAPMVEHRQFGMPGFAPFAGAIPGMPALAQPGQLGAHALLSLAARRPPFPVGGATPPHCPRHG